MISIGIRLNASSEQINGTTLTALEFVDLITTQFRAAYLATIVDIRDLNIVTTNENESAGVVGQWTIYVTRSKSDGQEIKQSATTIVKVEERNGQSVITGIWEAQTAGEA